MSKLEQLRRLNEEDSFAEDLTHTTLMAGIQQNTNIVLQALAQKLNMPIDELQNEMKESPEFQSEVNLSTSRIENKLKNHEQGEKDFFALLKDYDFHGDKSAEDILLELLGEAFGQAKAQKEYDAHKSTWLPKVREAKSNWARNHEQGEKDFFALLKDYDFHGDKSAEDILLELLGEAFGQAKAQKEYDAHKSTWLPKVREAKSNWARNHEQGEKDFFALLKDYDFHGDKSAEDILLELLGEAFGQAKAQKEYDAHKSTWLPKVREAKSNWARNHEQGEKDFFALLKDYDFHGDKSAEDILLELLGEAFGQAKAQKEYDAHKSTWLPKVREAKSNWARNHEQGEKDFFALLKDYDFHGDKSAEDILLELLGEAFGQAKAQKEYDAHKSTWLPKVREAKSNWARNHEQGEKDFFALLKDYDFHGDKSAEDILLELLGEAFGQAKAQKEYDAHKSTWLPKVREAKSNWARNHEQGEKDFFALLKDYDFHGDKSAEDILLELLGEAFGQAKAQKEYDAHKSTWLPKVREAKSNWARNHEQGEKDFFALLKDYDFHGDKSAEDILLELLGEAFGQAKAQKEYDAHKSTWLPKVREAKSNWARNHEQGEKDFFALLKDYDFHGDKSAEDILLELLGEAFGQAKAQKEYDAHKSTWLPKVREAKSNWARNHEQGEKDFFALLKDYDFHGDKSAEDILLELLGEAFGQAKAQKEYDAHKSTWLPKVREAKSNWARNHEQGEKDFFALLKDYDFHGDKSAEDILLELLGEAFGQAKAQKEYDAHKSTWLPKVREAKSNWARNHEQGEKDFFALLKDYDFHGDKSAEDILLELLGEAFGQAKAQKEYDAHKSTWLPKVREAKSNWARNHEQGEKDFFALLKDYDFHGDKSAEDILLELLGEAFGQAKAQKEYDAHKSTWLPKVREAKSNWARNHEQNMNQIESNILQWVQTLTGNLENIQSSDDLLSAYLQTHAQESNDIKKNWNDRFEKVFKQAYKDIERKKKEVSDNKLAEAKTEARSLLRLSKQDLGNAEFEDSQAFARAMLRRVDRLIDDLPPDRRKEFMDHVNILIDNLHDQWLTEQKDDGEEKQNELIANINRTLDTIDHQTLFLLAGNPSKFHAHMRNEVADILGRHAGPLGAALEQHFQTRSKKLYLQYRQSYELAINHSMNEIGNLSISPADLQTDFTQQSFAEYMYGKVQSLSRFGRNVPPALENLLSRKIDSLYNQWQQQNVQKDKEETPNRKPQDLKKEEDEKKEQDVKKEEAAQKKEEEDQKTAEDTTKNHAKAKKALDAALTLNYVDIKRMPLQKQSFDTSMQKRARDAVRTLLPDEKIPSEFQRMIDEGIAGTWKKHLNTATNVATKDIKHCTAIPSEQHVRNTAAFRTWLQSKLPSLARFPSGQPLPSGLVQAMEAKRNHYKEAQKEPEEMVRNAVRSWKPAKGIVDYAQFKAAFLKTLGNTEVANKHARTIDKLLAEKWLLYRPKEQVRPEIQEEEKRKVVIQSQEKVEDPSIEIEEQKSTERIVTPKEQSAAEIVNQKKERLQVVAGVDWKQIEDRLGLDAKQSQRMVNRFSFLMQSSGVRSLLLDSSKARYFGPVVLGLCATLEGSQFMNMIQEFKTETDPNRVPVLLFNNTERQKHIKTLFSSQPELLTGLTQGLHLMNLAKDDLYKEAVRERILSATAIDRQEDTEHEMAKHRINGKDITRLIDEDTYEDGSERLWQMLGASPSLQEMIRGHEQNFIPFLTVYFDGLSAAQFEERQSMFVHGTMEREDMLEMILSDSKLNEVKASSPAIWQKLQQGIDAVGLEQDTARQEQEEFEEEIEVIDAIEDSEDQEIVEQAFSPADEEVGEQEIKEIEEINDENVEQTLSPADGGELMKEDVILDDDELSKTVTDMEHTFTATTFSDLVAENNEQSIVDSEMEPLAENSDESISVTTDTFIDQDIDVVVQTSEESEQSIEEINNDETTEQAFSPANGEVGEQAIKEIEETNDATPEQVFLPVNEQESKQEEIEETNEINDEQEVIEIDESGDTSPQTEEELNDQETAEQVSLPADREVIEQEINDENVNDDMLFQDETIEAIHEIDESTKLEESIQEINNDETAEQAFLPADEQESEEEIEDNQSADTSAQEINDEQEVIENDESGDTSPQTEEELNDQEIAEQVFLPANEEEIDAIEDSEDQESAESNESEDNQSADTSAQTEEEANDQDSEESNESEEQIENNSDATPEQAFSPADEQEFEEEEIEDNQSADTSAQADGDTSPQTEEELNDQETTEQVSLPADEQESKQEEIEETNEINDEQEVIENDESGDTSPQTEEELNDQETTEQVSLPADEQESKQQEIEETNEINNQKQVFDIAELNDDSPIEILRLSYRELTVSFVQQIIDLESAETIEKNVVNEESDIEHTSIADTLNAKRRTIVEKLTEEKASQYVCTLWPMTRTRGPEQKEYERYMGALSLRNFLRRFSSTAKARYPHLQVQIDIPEDYLESGVRNHGQLSDDLSDFWFDCFTQDQDIVQISFSTNARGKQQKIISLNLEVQGQNRAFESSFVCILERQEHIYQVKKRPKNIQQNTKSTAA